MYELLNMDCRAVLANMADDSVDSIVTDPPYHLTSIAKRFGPGPAPAQFGTDGAFARAARGFMGQTWDGGDIAFDPSLWVECLRVLKPGGYLLAFSGTRTYHRMAYAIDEAGFEIRDMLSWLYGSGFPKSQNVALAMDKAAGAVGNRGAGFNHAGRGKSNGGSVYRSDHPDYIPPEYITPEAQQWAGWGTALKPACEPICLARKPLTGTVAANVIEWGTGALNIDGCRVPAQGRPLIESRANLPSNGVYGEGLNGSRRIGTTDTGRFPANVLHDGSPEVLAGFPETTSGGGPAIGTACTKVGVYGEPNANQSAPYGSNTGSAARFFYCAKASKADREVGCGHLVTDYDHSGPRGHTKNGDGSPRAATHPRGNIHPTVKPTDLMRWLVRLVTPRGGLVFDPFTGSGSTGRAAILEGCRFIGAELTPEYVPIARARIDAAVNGK